MRFNFAVFQQILVMSLPNLRLWVSRAYFSAGVLKFCLRKTDRKDGAGLEIIIKVCELCVSRMCHKLCQVWTSVEQQVWQAAEDWQDYSDRQFVLSCTVEAEKELKTGR